MNHKIKAETDMKSTCKTSYPRLVALLVMGMIAAVGTARADGWRDNDDKLAQAAELEQQIHATFHAAVSVHDPVNGDSPEVITKRIREALSIWSKDAKLTVVGTSPAAGNYIGNGDPDDPASCPLPSGDTSATGQQGTLCTFFKYVSGGLQQANKFVSLSPAYKTKFVPVRDHDGQWKSSVYFESHYFDVSLDPSTGQPFWTAKSHVSLDGKARKIGGRWLLTHVSSSAVPVPVP
jgi:type II secretory pathway pseudopilin PulG